MTSGVFQSYPLSSIWVDRAARQRRDLEGIDELADSIKRVGLINPPVVRRSGELVAGERRFEALKSLGWTHAPVQIAEEMDPAELRAIELEENIRRLALPWQDECKAVEEYHQLRKAADAKWTDEQTGAALGMTKQAVGQKRDVARELAKGNSRIAEAPKFSTARGIIQRDTERKTAAIKEQLSGAPKEDEVPILNVSFHDWAPAYSGPKFNFIHCDFPYGVNAQNMDMQEAAANLEHGTYEDRPEIYWELIERLNLSMNNVVAESAHLMFWFSMDYYQLTKERLIEMGWWIEPHPLIWFRSDNSGIAPDVNRRPRRVYETCFFGSRGDRKIVNLVSNLFAGVSTKEHHMSEKPLPMLRHFFRMVCDEYTTALDPTCGSGNAIVAAKLGGGNRVLGLEIEGTFHAKACANYHRAVNGTNSQGEE